MSPLTLIVNQYPLRTAPDPRRVSNAACAIRHPRWVPRIVRDIAIHGAATSHITHTNADSNPREPPPGTTSTAFANALVRLLALSLLLCAWMPAHALNIQQYAKQCAAQMNGIEVPDFDCSDGVELPMVGAAGGDCAKPPYLPGAGCYKYSRIGRIDSGDADIAMVYMCRHKSVVGSNTHPYMDIAVIQANLSTGAACFFQALARGETLGPAMPKPDSAPGLRAYMSPDEMALPDNACVQCHDAGPFLRTPYVKQAGNGIFSPANRTEYFFPEMATWNGAVFKVRTDPGEDKVDCNQCHNMGSNEINRATRGTSAWLGNMSTGVDPSPHLIGDTGYWMRPGLSAPGEPSQTGSGAYYECAVNDGGHCCVRSLFGGQAAELRRMSVRGVLPDPPDQPQRPRDPNRPTLLNPRGGYPNH